MWGNRWEEEPSATIDFLLLLLPLSIPLETFQPWHNAPKSLQKILSGSPPTPGSQFPPKNPLPKESSPLLCSESTFEDSSGSEAVGSTRNAREPRSGEVPAGFGPFWAPFLGRSDPERARGAALSVLRIFWAPQRRQLGLVGVTKSLLRARCPQIQPNSCGAGATWRRACGAWPASGSSAWCPSRWPPAR